MFVLFVCFTDSFEAQFLRVLHRVNCTIERNEIRLADQERRECTEIEWKQVRFSPFL